MINFRPALVAALIFFAPFAAKAAEVVTVNAPEGVEAWLSEEHTIPMIAVSISIPGGSVRDPEDLPGLASMMSALLDEGAGDLDDTSYKEELETYAIRLGFGSGREFLTATMSTLTENADEAFRLLALALQEPRFDAAPIERIRAQTIAGLRQDEEDPGTVAAKAWSEAYFLDSPYAHYPDGNFESVAAITANDIKSFAEEYIARGGIKIAVAGDITPERYEAYLNQIFGPLPLRDIEPIAPPQDYGAPETHVIDMDIPQPAAIFGMRGPLRHDPDFIPAYIANYILGGGGFSSRLMDEVREKRGLTYGISTGLNDYLSAARIMGSVKSERTRIATALDVTRDVMQDFAENGITEMELTDAKTYLTGSFPLSLDSNTKIAGVLNGFQRVGLGPEYVAERNDLIEAVTMEQVNAVAARYFNPENMLVVIAGTPANAEDAAAAGDAAPAEVPEAP